MTTFMAHEKQTIPPRMVDEGQSNSIRVNEIIHEKLSVADPMIVKSRNVQDMGDFGDFMMLLINISNNINLKKSDIVCTINMNIGWPKKSRNIVKILIGMRFSY